MIFAANPGMRLRRRAASRTSIVGVVVTAVALVGCASVQGRLERGLMQAGVSPMRSECMARHMTDRLTTAQLRRLARLQQLKPELLEAHGLEAYLANAQALGDPKIVTVTSAVAVGCALVEP